MAIINTVFSTAKPIKDYNRYNVPNLSYPLHSTYTEILWVEIQPTTSAKLLIPSPYAVILYYVLENNHHLQSWTYTSSFRYRKPSHLHTINLQTGQCVQSDKKK